MSHTRPTYAVGSYHHIGSVDWRLLSPTGPVQHMRCTATTIFVQRTGEYLANKTQYICLIPVQHMRCAATTIFVQLTGEYLANKTQYICLIPVQHMQWAATTIYVQWTGDYCGPQDLSKICGAQLPPYLFRGLVSIWPTRLRIYVSHRPTYVVGSYHHICSVDW